MIRTDVFVAVLGTFVNRAADAIAARQGAQSWATWNLVPNAPVQIMHTSRKWSAL